MHKLTRMYDGIHDIGDMQDIQLERVKHFFTHYKDLEPGKWAKIEKIGNVADARQVILDSIEGMTERLNAGATVVDIGCGAGVAATVIATAYPNSTVVGIDPSVHAIEVATERAAAAGLDNLSFRSGTFDDLADLAGVAPAGVDLLLTLDVIHDLPRPGDAVRAARSCLADDGVWFVADIKTRGGLEDNRAIPVLPLMYGMSILYCMSSAMSEPGGAGLGTLGLTEHVFGELTAAAGFTRIETREFEVDPLNRYYEVRVR